LIDNLIFYNSVIQHSWVDLTSSGGGGGGDFPPWPNLETVCLHPPSVEGPVPVLYSRDCKMQPFWYEILVHVYMHSVGQLTSVHWKQLSSALLVLLSQLSRCLPRPRLLQRTAWRNRRPRTRCTIHSAEAPINTNGLCNILFSLSLFLLYVVFFSIRF